LQGPNFSRQIHSDHVGHLIVRDNYVVEVGVALHDIKGGSAIEGLVNPLDT
jgi:hypothetical protein